jgi:sensor histidine kinase regulating citrate/malate metabolism
MILNPEFLGILLLLTGLLFLLLVLGLPRIVHRRPNPISEISAQKSTDISSQTRAVLIIQPGGRVDYINPIARQLFDLREGEQSNLEVLAHQIRPSDDFLKICAAEGQTRF